MKISFSNVLATALLVGIGFVTALGQGVPKPEPAAVAEPESKVPVYSYRVVQSWPHDKKAFTQGLVFHDGYLFESTGRYGDSSLRRVELSSGKVKKRERLDNKFFGEGLTLLGDKLYQLTWTAHKGFIYSLNDLSKLGEFPYEFDGWGLTNDGTNLILSDGSNTLRFLDPLTGKVLCSINVMDGKKPIKDLNELEFIKGEIWANIWHSDRIARIEPTSGAVIAWVDLTGLLPKEMKSEEEAVLNGIAYDAVSDRIFVTGKLWPRVYEIRLVKP